jgi:transposase
MFTICTSGKQLACYCGVVPFDYQSGISIKGKHHVHKMANKELKRLLNMCALTSIKNYKEFKHYYERKKREGEHAMSILNAIKNKLVLRTFAVVKMKELMLITMQKPHEKFIKSYLVKS